MYKQNNNDNKGNLIISTGICSQGNMENDYSKVLKKILSRVSMNVLLQNTAVK